MGTQTDISVSHLFKAISFQLGGIAITFLANSVNYILILFAETNGHEVALSIPIIATALFTIVWGDATLKSQVAHVMDAGQETRKTQAYKDIAQQPYRLLRLMNFVLALALAASQLSILYT